MNDSRDSQEKVEGSSYVYPQKKKKRAPVQDYTKRGGKNIYASKAPGGVYDPNSTQVEANPTPKGPPNLEINSDANSMVFSKTKHAPEDMMPVVSHVLGKSKRLQEGEKTRSDVEEDPSVYDTYEKLKEVLPGDLKMVVWRGNNVVLNKLPNAMMGDDVLMSAGEEYQPQEVKLELMDAFTDLKPYRDDPQPVRYITSNDVGHHAYFEQQFGFRSPYDNDLGLREISDKNTRNLVLKKGMVMLFQKTNVNWNVYIHLPDVHNSRVIKLSLSVRSDRANKEFSKNLDIFTPGLSESYNQGRSDWRETLAESKSSVLNTIWELGLLHRIVQERDVGKKDRENFFNRNALSLMELFSFDKKRWNNFISQYVERWKVGGMLNDAFLFRI